MRSSRVVRASDSKCRLVATVLSSIPGAADESVLNIVHKKKKSKKSPFNAGKLKSGRMEYEVNLEKRIKEVNLKSGEMDPMR
jgi:hypothetical protein